jgi:hypothetical protein
VLNGGCLYEAKELGDHTPTIRLALCLNIWGAP